MIANEVERDVPAGIEVEGDVGVSGDSERKPPLWSQLRRLTKSLTHLKIKSTEQSSKSLKVVVQVYGSCNDVHVV